MKILLAVDGSIYTKKMLAYLTSRDEFFGSTIKYTVLTVQPTLPPRVRGAVGKDIVGNYYADESGKVLNPVCKFLRRHDIDPIPMSKVGPAGEIIARTADAGQYDMIIMGSHGHGALKSLVMGSVAAQVLAHCKVPVLLVR
ncbi:MAG: universal stress protein [Rhodoferax sp.]